MAKNITLNWTAPKQISELDYPYQHESGIYVWGFSIEDDFIPYYVGIADNIVHQMYAHISSIVSGKYTIYHKDSLAKFREFKNQDDQSDMSKGKIYSPDWPRSFKRFWNKREELRPHIDCMFDNFTFSYAVVDKAQFSSKDRKEIEKICINQIGKERLANTRSGHCDKLMISHTGDPTII